MLVSPRCSIALIVFRLADRGRISSLSFNRRRTGLPGDCTYTESCRRLKLAVRDYLAAVLPGFADLPIQRLPELTPAACVSQHS